MTVLPVAALTAVVVLVPPVRRRAVAVAVTAGSAMFATGGAALGAAIGVGGVAVDGVVGVGRAALIGGSAAEPRDRS